MASGALDQLVRGIEEVQVLKDARPRGSGGSPVKSHIVRVINRASVVLLTSHLERYVRGVNEEATDVINSIACAPERLPELLRLEHSRVAIDSMLETQWKNRSKQLADLVHRDAWLWGSAEKGALEAGRILRWMKTPTPNRIKRMYERWGIGDIFTKITRAAHTRDRIWSNLKELTDRRNRIAHGDHTVTATTQEINLYIRVVREFCARADRALSGSLVRMLSCPKPW